MRIINLVENTEGASGCGFEHGLSFYIETAHHKLLMDRYRELYGEEPDYVISGFHMMRGHGYSEEDFAEIRRTAMELQQYKTVFCTGHCTGEEPFEVMKKLMSDKLRYVHSGDEICI